MTHILQNTISQLSNIEKMDYLCRKEADKYPMPSTDVIKDMVKLIRAILFPGYFGDANVNPKNIGTHIEKNILELQTILIGQIKSGICFQDSTQNFHCNDLQKIADHISSNFITRLPDLRRVLQTDIIAAYNGDPAAKSYGEVIFCYPSIKAITNYRIANILLTLNVPIIPRVITEMAHSETGIDIHPGATIGEYFMIDHGTGVVIGETSVIGNNVKLYQGVTLGAKSFPIDKNGNPIKGIDRHPKIGNNVIIYSNSTVLGNIKVGNNAVIGGNIWIDTDVPEGAKLSQKKRDEEIAGEQRKEYKKEKKSGHKDLKYDKNTVYIHDRATFKICKKCDSKYGCKKCRDKWQKKYGKKIDNRIVMR